MTLVELVHRGTDKEMVSSAMIAELDAITLYQSQINTTKNEKIKNILQHIMDEEKEHLVELYCILKEIDSTQKQMDSKPRKDCLHE